MELNDLVAAEARFDWSAYVDAHGALRAVRGRRDEYLMHCPDCNKNKLAVNVMRRAWRCFVCNDGGREAASLIAKIQQIRWHEALIEVLTGQQAAIGRIDQLSAVVTEEKPRQWIPKEVLWPEGFEAIGVQSRTGMQGIAYCMKRGIPDYVAQAMRLGVCTSGRFRNRLVFPVFDGAGRLVFYQGRAMWEPRAYERHIKTLSLRVELDKDDCPITAGASDCLLNLEYISTQEDSVDRVLVVEGPIDCAHAWPDAVATFGKRISGKQIELLVRAGIKELDLCYDADAAEDMLRQAPALADLFLVRVVQLPTGTDPGDLTKDEIEYHRGNAIEWGTGERVRRVLNIIR